MTCLMERNVQFACLQSHHCYFSSNTLLCCLLWEALQWCFSALCNAVTCQVLHQMKLAVGLSTNWVAKVPTQGHCQVAVDFSLCSTGFFL